jgi:hypothetical protein
MQNKPSSKAISVTSGFGENIYITTIVCEDGSIWEYQRGGGWDPEWICILEAPTQPKSDLPEVGSRWRRKDESKGKYPMTIANIRIYSEEFTGSHNLHEFLKEFEPIPTQSDKKE